MKYLQKLIKVVMKRGKHGKANKIFMKALTKVMRRCKEKKIEKYIEKKLDIIRPMVKIYKKRVAGKLYHIPSRIKKGRSIFQMIKWIVLAAKADKRGIGFGRKLGKSLNDVLKEKGVAMEYKNQFMAIIKENRSYMRFIKRKRKKWKKWRFDHRFSKKQNDIEINRKKRKEEEKERKYRYRRSEKAMTPKKKKEKKSKLDSKKVVKKKVLKRKNAKISSKKFDSKN